MPYRHAPRVLTHLDIPELGDFLDGYIGGWLPDGWITLGSPGQPPGGTRRADES
ncbi:hypothetical protein ABZ545_30960 [Streptomyces abikoensis]|uniref:hypothetical protein n=1 Tax=Streptomyces TaxID=1883 RepID=UPI0013DF67C9|nr:hypothetical protein [Streptomyces luteoverticillatus]